MQQDLVITADEPGFTQKLHLGLVPSRAANTKFNIRTLNAISEEVLEKEIYCPVSSEAYDMFDPC
jgi:hypothetical protein